MPKFKCDVCGQVQEGLPMVLAYLRPADYFKIPENERDSRIQYNEDVCIIDNSEFIVRGVLEIPIVNGQEPFEWGIWAIIDEQDFIRYLELWNSDTADDEPPFDGKLSGGMQAYPESDLLDVQVKLRSGNKRPLFFVKSDEHPLGIDQRNGITMDRVHGFIEDAMPHLFNENG